MLNTIVEKFVYASQDFDLGAMIADPEFLKVKTKSGKGIRSKEYVGAHIKQVFFGNRPVYIEVNIRYSANMPKRDVDEMHNAIKNHFFSVAGEYEF